MWSGFIWLRIRNISVFHKILGIPWVAEKLAVSQGYLSSVESVTNSFRVQGTDDNERNNVVIVSREIRTS
jgi:hypothetical protein